MEQVSNFWFVLGYTRQPVQKINTWNLLLYLMEILMYLSADSMKISEAEAFPSLANCTYSEHV